MSTVKRGVVETIAPFRPLAKNETLEKREDGSYWRVSTVKVPVKQMENGIVRTTMVEKTAESRVDSAKDLDYKLKGGKLWYEEAYAEQERAKKKPAPKGGPKAANGGE